MQLKTIPLRIRLTLLIIAVAGPLVIIMIYLLTQNASTHIKQEADETLRLSNRALASTTQSWLDFHVSALAQLVGNPEILGMNAKRQTPHLELMARVYHFMYLVSTTDMQGKNIARSDDNELTDYQDRIWFQSAINGSSPVFQSLIGRTSKQPAMIVSMPIRDRNGTIVGVGMFAALLQELTTEVKATTIGKTGYAYVIDAQNRVIAHPDSAYTAQLLDFSGEPPVAALRAGKRGIFEFVDKKGVTWRSYVEVLKNGWGIIVQQDQSEIMAPLTDLEEHALFILILGPIVLMALSWFMIRRALKPVSILTDTAIAIAKGDLSRTALITGDDEIGLLAKTFNTMTERLRGVISSLEDRIKEKEEAQTALRKSEEKYRSLVENVNIGVFRNTPGRGRFIQANPAIARMFGYESAEEFMGVEAADLYQDPEGRKSLMKEILQRGFVKDREFAMRKKDGTPIWCSLTSTAQYGEDGEIKWMDGVVEDITERRKAAEDIRKLNEELEQRVIDRTRQLESANMELKNAQSRILQQEKMASIGQLAAGVAHEINNPMGFIISNLGSLERYMGKIVDFVQLQAEAISKLAHHKDVNDDEIIEGIDRQKKAMKFDFIMCDLGNLIKESRDGADRVKKIVQDMKNFSRVDEFELKMANIHDGLDSTITIVWNELKYKAELKKEYGDIPLTVCNPGQLNQVFMNILINAAQAIPEHGIITVRTRSDGSKIFISISDTGAGIPSDKIGRIFEPFFTTKDVGQGTGLGLSIAYDIIKKHHGEILLESEVGKGTTFTIVMPVVSENEQCG